MYVTHHTKKREVNKHKPRYLLLPHLFTVRSMMCCMCVIFFMCLTRRYSLLKSIHIKSGVWCIFVCRCLHLVFCEWIAMMSLWGQRFLRGTFCTYKSNGPCRLAKKYSKGVRDSYKKSSTH